MSTRDSILARIRGALAAARRPQEAAGSVTDAVAWSMAPRLRPAAGSDPVGRFVAKSRAMASTVEQVPARADAPAAVRRYLDALALPRVAVIWDELADLPWAEAGLAVRTGPASGTDPIGITGAFCALSETGTLVLLGGSATAATTSLLPETHIAVVHASRIVRGMEEGFALVRAERGCLPRAVNFVSGPSRTGDIEQTIVLGAHGPCRVHIIVVDGA